MMCLGSSRSSSTVSRTFTALAPRRLGSDGQCVVWVPEGIDQHQPDEHSEHHDVAGGACDR